MTVSSILEEVYRTQFGPYLDMQGSTANKEQLIREIQQDYGLAVFYHKHLKALLNFNEHREYSQSWLKTLRTAAEELNARLFFSRKGVFPHGNFAFSYWLSHVYIKTTIKLYQKEVVHEVV